MEIVELDNEIVKKEKPVVSLAAVVSTLLAGSNVVKSSNEVLDRFHRGGEFANRDLPMVASLKFPRGVEGLEVNALYRERIFGENSKTARLRREIIDVHCRASVGGDKGAWRKLTVDATGRQLAQEFEIKKRSKTENLIGTG